MNQEKSAKSPENQKTNKPTNKKTSNGKELHCSNLNPSSDRGLAPKRFSMFAEGMYEETLFYIILLLKRRPYDGVERSE